MQEDKKLSRRGFLENAGALMAVGTFAHLGIGNVEGADGMLSLAPGSSPDRGGLGDVRRASRVNPSLIRRLYETDAPGIVDDELIDEVGHALHARCRSILLATEAHERGRVRCPSCGHLIVRPTGVPIQAVEITCDRCAWSVRGSDYLKTYQDKHLHGGGAVALFEAFIEQFERAPLPRGKVLAIDRLIHGFHCTSMGGPGRIAATNLIYAKNKRELLAFLDTLPYGEGSTPALRDHKEEWERMLERSNQPADA
jgi:ribosomal protein L37AE/L43A